MSFKKTTLPNWLLAIRPKTLFASAGPVLIGISLAYSELKTINQDVALTILICTLLLQISSNLINDYYDGIDGTDDKGRLGPPRVTALGLIKPGQVKVAFLFTLALSFLLGVKLMLIGGLPIVIIGLTSLFFSWAYTGGPYPLSKLGLGEIFAFIYFGPVAVWGTHWLLNPTSGMEAAYLGMAPGILSASLMAINNLRDRNGDLKAHKRTIAVRLSEQSARRFTYFLIHTLLVLIVVFSFYFNNFYFLFSLLPLVIFYSTFRKILKIPLSKEFNNILASVGKSIFINSALISLGLLI